MLFANRSAGLSPLILAFVWAWNATGDEPAATQPPWHLERGIVLFANPHGGKKPARILTITPEGSLLDSIATIEEGTLLPGRISPDGKKLAFTREQRPNGKPGVWIMGADRKPVLMTDDGWVVAWSPDGSRLALFRLSADEPPKCESLLLDVKTKELHRLPIPQTDLVMDWSPDGRDLLVTAGNPDRHFDHPTKGRYPLRHIYRVRGGRHRACPTGSSALDR